MFKRFRFTRTNKALDSMYLRCAIKGCSLDYLNDTKCDYEKCLVPYECSTLPPPVSEHMDCMPAPPAGPSASGAGNTAAAAPTPPMTPPGTAFVESPPKSPSCPPPLHPPPPPRWPPGEVPPSSPPLPPNPLPPNAPRQAAKGLPPGAPPPPKPPPSPLPLWWGRALSYRSDGTGSAHHARQLLHTLPVHLHLLEDGSITQQGVHSTIHPTNFSIRFAFTGTTADAEASLIYIRTYNTVEMLPTDDLVRDNQTVLQRLVPFLVQVGDDLSPPCQRPPMLVSRGEQLFQARLCVEHTDGTGWKYALFFQAAPQAVASWAISAVPLATPRTPPPPLAPPPPEPPSDPGSETTSLCAVFNNCTLDVVPTHVMYQLAPHAEAQEVRC